MSRIILHYLFFSELIAYMCCSFALRETQLVFILELAVFNLLNQILDAILWCCYLLGQGVYKYTTPHFIPQLYYIIIPYNFCVKPQLITPYLSLYLNLILLYY